MLRLILILLLVMSTSIFFITGNAEAKRFGGGRSIGMQRSMTHSSGKAATNAVGNTAAKSGNRWWGALAGLAIGGLLASLFFGSGLLGNIGWILLAVIAVAIIFSIMRRRSAGTLQQHRASYAMPNQHINTTAFQQEMGSSPATSSTIAMPNTFDRDAFLREAKSTFLRLQAAYDEKNLNDIRAFTTPAVYAEIAMQLEERNDAINQTSVLGLNAELLDYSAATNEQNTIISVRFDGHIREDAAAEYAAFSEVWHFEQQNNLWRVAGIEQQA